MTWRCPSPFLRLAIALPFVAAAGCRQPAGPAPVVTHDTGAAAADDAGRVKEPEGTYVVLLGTGTPVPDPGRSGPSLAVVAGGHSYVVDFGPGVVRRASAAFKKGLAAMDVTSLDRAFATHLHSDHTAGLADLILTPWEMGRAAPVEIYGPPGTGAMVDNLLEAYSEDLAVRSGGGTIDEIVPAVAREVGPGPFYEDGNVTIEAFLVSHGDWKHAYGYRFAARDRTIVVSGDTGPCDAIAKACAGCDVLVHEAYSAAMLGEATPSMKAYHSRHHTSGIELGKIAAAAKPKLLVLTHELLWGATEASLVGEIRQNWDGEIAFGNDMDVY